MSISALEVFLRECAISIYIWHWHWHNFDS